MDEERRRQAERLLVERPCARGCKCYKVNLNDICKARTFGVESLLECLEEDPVNCRFAFPFGGTNFCKCGLRLEIAKLLSDEEKVDEDLSDEKVESEGTSDTDKY